MKETWHDMRRLHMAHASRRSSMRHGSADTATEGGASDRPLMCVPSQIHPFSESENHYIQAAWVEDEMGTVLFLQCEGGFARVRPRASAPSIRD